MFTAGFFLTEVIKRTGITRRAEDYTDSLINRKDRREILCILMRICDWKWGGLYQYNPKFLQITAIEGHEKLCARLHSQQKLWPVDKKDLICEEGEDLLLLLRYDPPFRSHPLLWDHDSEIVGGVSRKNNRKTVRMSLWLATGHIVGVCQKR